jgi:hypothetical protein
VPSRRIPFSVHISYLSVGLLVAFAAITNTFQFNETRRLITEEVAQHYALLGEHTLADIIHTYRAAALGSRLLAKQRLMQASNLEQRLESLSWLVTAF